MVSFWLLSCRSGCKYVSVSKNAALLRNEMGQVFKILSTEQRTNELKHVLAITLQL